MRLYNADVDEAERNREEFEEFDEPEDEECVGEGHEGEGNAGWECIDRSSRGDVEVGFRNHSEPTDSPTDYIIFIIYAYLCKK